MRQRTLKHLIVTVAVVLCPALWAFSPAAKHNTTATVTIKCFSVLCLITPPVLVPCLRSIAGP